MSSERNHVPLTLEARRRLSSHVGQAYNGSRAARTRLRLLARSIARRLIAAGWSPEAVSTELARVVTGHPASIIDAHRRPTTRAPRAIGLVDLTRQSVSDVVLELGERPPGSGRTSIGDFV